MKAADLTEILVIEDDLDIRVALAEILTDAGYEPATAANGQDALAYLDNGGTPSLIVLDLMMPVMDGWTFRRELLRRPGGDRVPIIVFSGFGSPSVSRMEGRVRYLAKPIKMETLLSMIAGELSCPQDRSQGSQLQKADSRL